MTIQKPVQHAVVVHHFLFNKMLIATWNINSVRIRLQIIEGWIQERNPDIILLQEIKCENDSFPKSVGNRFRQVPHRFRPPELKKK